MWCAAATVPWLSSASAMCAGPLDAHLEQIRGQPPGPGWRAAQDLGAACHVECPHVAELSRAEPALSIHRVRQDAYAPFGGTGASGNGARFGSQSSWDEFTQWRWVTVRDQAHGFPF
jgi:hypothetical protein